MWLSSTRVKREYSDENCNKLKASGVNTNKDHVNNCLSHVQVQPKVLLPAHGIFQTAVCSELLLLAVLVPPPARPLPQDFLPVSLFTGLFGPTAPAEPMALAAPRG